MKKIYLSGPMLNCTFMEIHLWRHMITTELKNKYKFFDPTFRKINVAQDKNDIRNSDLLIANCWKPSIGTSMEIMYAYCVGTPILIIGKKKKLTPWITRHANLIVPHVPAAVKVLKNE